MLIHVPGVLGAEEVSQFRKILEEAEWVDGRATAGHQSGTVKHNQQLPEQSAVARELGERVLAALERSPLFITAALPHRVFPPLFNRYGEGMGFGLHVDNSVRQMPGTPHRLRTDISCTLFLSEPDEYDGGELVIDDIYGAHSVKLPAGDLIVYPASSLHRVQRIARGARLASFFWVQSMIRDDATRSMLCEIDLSIQQLREDLRGLPGRDARGGDHPALVSLTNTYHNLLRRFAEL